MSSLRRRAGRGSQAWPRRIRFLVFRRTHGGHLCFIRISLAASLVRFVISAPDSSFQDAGLREPWCLISKCDAATTSPCARAHTTRRSGRYAARRMGWAALLTVAIPAVSIRPPLGCPAPSFAVLFFGKVTSEFEIPVSKAAGMGSMVELLKALGEAASTDVPDKVANNRRAIGIVASPVPRTRKRRLCRIRRYREG